MVTTTTAISTKRERENISINNNNKNKKMNFKQALFVLLTTALIGRSYEDEVLGCGGFVKLSSKFKEGLSSATAAPIDFTKISVRLLEKGSGEVKMSTECSPTGYFFVPAYEAGDYDLTVFDTANDNGALTFSPSSIPVTIGGSSSATSAAADLSKLLFEVTGLSIAGAISGVSNAEGVSLTLISADTKSVISQQTISSTSFRFSNVLPGRYEIAAVRAGWRFAQSYVAVDATGARAAPVVAAPALVVAGFDVTGSVLSGKKSMGGVVLALYGDGAVPAKCNKADSTAPAVAGSVGGKPLACIVTSTAAESASNNFGFEGVPAGEYVIVPYFTGDNAGCEVDPKRADISVGEAGAASLERPFRVVGFGVRGRVEDASGRGVAGVAVRLGKSKSAITDPTGEYRIDGLTPADAGTSARLAASKEHYVFDDVASVELSTARPVLPTLRAAKYEVCGRVTVVVPPAGARSAYPRTVAFSDAAKKIITKKTDGNGAFCVAVAPGAYKLSVADAAGLSIEPAEVPVTVTAEPILNVEFRQKTFTITGEIHAISTANNNNKKTVAMTLTGPVQKTTTVELTSTATAGFEFNGLVEGKYTIAIVNAEKDGWCWAAASQTVEVTAASAAPAVVFAQKGYRLTVTASHALTVAAVLNGKDAAVFTTPADICLAEPGAYALEVRTPGYELAEASYAFDTSKADNNNNNNAIALKVARFRVTGTVTTPSAEAAQAIAVGTAEGVPVTTTVEGSTVTYAAFVAPGATVRFVPSGPADMMFYPPERVFHLASAEKPSAALEAIAGRPGLYLRGRVTPPTEGVRVSIVPKTPENAAAIETVLTDKNGAYVAGPFRDDVEYRELFSHKGLVFNCTNCEDSSSAAERVVVAMRLSSITVTVKDSQSGAPLPGVVISVSGGFGDSIYAANAPTEADGAFTSGEIFPGAYYVRPMLKEYVFEPATRSIDVVEGDAPEVSFVATRVAYSAYGRVISLDGTPKASVPVVATPAKGAASAASVEQATTDAAGNYRIRGLVPGVVYTVGITTSNANVNDVITASPKAHTLTISAETPVDARNIDFVAYSRPDVTTGRVAVRVVADRSVLPTLEASLRPVNAAAAAANAAQRVMVGAVPIVEFGHLAEGKYEFSVESSLTKKHYTCKSTPEKLLLDVVAQKEEVQGKITVVCGAAEGVEEGEAANSEAEKEKKRAKASVLSLIGLVAVIVASVKHQEIIAVIKKNAKAGNGGGIVSGNANAANATVNANAAAKKAKYYSLVGEDDKSDFLPKNPNPRYTANYKRKNKK